MNNGKVIIIRAFYFFILNLQSNSIQTVWLSIWFSLNQVHLVIFKRSSSARSHRQHFWFESDVFYLLANGVPIPQNALQIKMHARSGRTAVWSCY